MILAADDQPIREPPAGDTTTTEKADLLWPGSCLFFWSGSSRRVSPLDSADTMAAFDGHTHLLTHKCSRSTYETLTPEPTQEAAVNSVEMLSV